MKDNIKITGTRSQITVEINDKVLIIEGELTTTPSFYADINSIKKWEPPNDGVIISDEDKKTIIEKIIKESEKKGVKIIFD